MHLKPISNYIVREVISTRIKTGRFALTDEEALRAVKLGLNTGSPLYISGYDFTLAKDASGYKLSVRPSDPARKPRRHPVRRGTVSSDAPQAALPSMTISPSIADESYDAHDTEDTTAFEPIRARSSVFQDRRFERKIARSAGRDIHSGNYSYRGRNDFYKHHRTKSIRKFVAAA
ncbi:MAG: hypothetical protein C0402_05235 [Thermodesulfovibrio sp.]|nr:hypothetical protein [Thermodesulfovibrio sp.]